MTRGLSANHTTEVSKQVVRPAVLVKIDSTPAVNVWSGAGSITVDGTTYTGVGEFGNIDVINETSEVEAPALSLTLSGIPSANLVLAFDDTEQGAAVTVYLVFFDEAGALVDSTPITAYRGYVETFDIVSDGKTATVRVNTNNLLSKLFGNNISRYTHEEQQRRYPGDMGLQHITTIQDKEFTWK